MGSVTRTAVAVFPHHQQTGRGDDGDDASIRTQSETFERAG